MSKQKTTYPKKTKRGCPICSKISYREKRKKPTEKFLEEAQKIHGDKYDYSKVKFATVTKKVEVVCKKHGSF